jgi:hypothetical protein
LNNIVNGWLNQQIKQLKQNILTNKKKNHRIHSEREYTINTQYIIYINLSKRLSRGKLHSQGRLSKLNPLRSDGSWDNRQEDGPCGMWPKALRTKLAQGGPSGLSTLRSHCSRDSD